MYTKEAAINKAEEFLRIYNPDNIDRSIINLADLVRVHICNLYDDTKSVQSKENKLHYIGLLIDTVAEKLGNKDWDFIGSLLNDETNRLCDEITDELKNKSTYVFQMLQYPGPGGYSWNIFSFAKSYTAQGVFATAQFALSSAVCDRSIASALISGGALYVLLGLLSYSLIQSSKGNDMGRIFFICSTSLSCLEVCKCTSNFFAVTPTILNVLLVAADCLDQHIQNNQLETMRSNISKGVSEITASRNLYCSH